MATPIEFVDKQWEEWIEKNHMDILQKIMSRVLSEKSIIIKILINENIKKKMQNILQ